MDTEKENAIERAKDAVALWLKLYGPGADERVNAWVLGTAHAAASDSSREGVACAPGERS